MADPRPAAAAAAFLSSVPVEPRGRCDARRDISA